MVKQLLLKAVAAILLLAATSPGLFAQNHPIKGTVTDANGAPIIGASVFVVGDTSTGAVTDVNGRFTLSVPSEANINVSCIGYASKVIPTEGKTDFNIVLEEDNEFLEETVVIGYGVQKKSDVTGAVASVRSEDLVNRSSENAALALQGKAAGVTVLNSSGAPGAGSDIRVRGYSSNSSNIGPLLIVDGLKVSSIQYLDPSMIESMEILKDAASAAIYGAEAGNGVVLITTKSGSSSDGQVFYNFQVTRNSLGKKAHVLNAEEYINFMTEAEQFTREDLANIYGYNGKTDTNWADVVFNPSFTYQHTIGVQGSNDRSKYFVTIANYNSDGIVVGKKDTYKRLSAQVNAEYKIKKWLTVGTNTSFEKYDTQSVGEHSEYSGSSLLGATIMDPLTPVVYENESELSAGMKDAIAKGIQVYKNADGKYYATSKLVESDAANPLMFIDRSQAKNTGINVRGTMFANFMPLKGLVYTSRFGFRLGQNYSSDYQDPYYANAKAHSETYKVSSTTSNSRYYQWENFANYTFNLAKNNFGLMAGMSFIKNETFSNGGSITGEDPLTGYADNFRYIAYGNGTETKTLSGGVPGTSTSIAYFGRLTWNYDNRYNFQANFRADAFDSSKLSKANRWGYFPSFSAGWTISNEHFFKDNVSDHSVSLLKLRASWGRNGNISVLSEYPYTASIALNGQKYQYSLTDKTFQTGSAPSGYANPDLTWETSEQMDFGLDARFLDNRLTLGADYYLKKTKDLLVPIKPVSEIGVSRVTVNAGSVENKGLEFELGWKDNIGGFRYSVNGNIATLDNKVTYLDPTVGRIPGATFSNFELITYFEEGYPVWYMRGYQYEGVDPETGKGKYKDVNNDGEVTSADLDNVGSGMPKATFGLTINLGYKNWDFTLFGNGVAGNDIYSCVYRTEHPRINSLEYFYNERWTASNHNSKFPSSKELSLDNKFWGSTANLFDGSYFKIKQIQLGYSFPRHILQKTGLANLRMFASLDDFFVFTKYPGFDPETASSGNVNSLGFDKGSYPTSRKAVFGVNLSF